MASFYLLWVIFSIFALASHSVAGEPTPATIEAAAERGLAITRQAGRNWLQNKSCFSCHHQTLPMLADVEAVKAGFKTNAADLKAQADHSHLYFRERIDLMNAGRHLGGGSSTAGYGLWAMMLDQRPPDATTEATVSYLLASQGIARLDRGVPDKEKEAVRLDGPWLPSCSRAPITSSRIGTTVLALIGMQHYATKKQQQAVDDATKLAEAWLAKAPLRDTEDYNWRLWGLQQLGGDDTSIKAIQTTLIAMQREDGGWAQTKELASDAYATGQVLYILRQTGLSAANPVAKRATAYLVRTQKKDGSWLVESRVKYKAQPYFDNGDPHEKDQFLSIAASSWATAALLTMCPQRSPTNKR